MPWFEFFIIEPVEENNIFFDSEKNLMNTKMPILILHAQDDIVIPYTLGEKVNALMNGIYYYFNTYVISIYTFTITFTIYEHKHIIPYFIVISL